jgi:hypothetical protein
MGTPSKPVCDCELCEVEEGADAEDVLDDELLPQPAISRDPQASKIVSLRGLIGLGTVPALR